MKLGLAFRNHSGAFTLIEVVMATALAATTVGASVYAYVMAAQRSEWSAYALAAQSLAVQQLEQCRAAKWDPMAYPPVDELVSSNFPPSVNILDIPISGTNIVRATNITTITVISQDPPLKQIRVDCRWPFYQGGHFTNTIVTYRAPDQ